MRPCCALGVILTLAALALSAPAARAQGESLPPEELAGLADVFLSLDRLDTAFLCCAVLHQEHPGTRWEVKAESKARAILKRARKLLWEDRRANFVGCCGFGDAPWEEFFRRLALLEPGLIYLRGPIDVARCLEAARVLTREEDVSWLRLPVLQAEAHPKTTTLLDVVPVSVPAPHFPFRQTPIPAPSPPAPLPSWHEGPPTGLSIHF